jgi:hypothetical protein
MPSPTLALLLLSLVMGGSFQSLCAKGSPSQAGAGGQVSKSTVSAPEVLTNKDVVSMLNAGLTEEIVSTPALSSTLRDEFLYIDTCQLDASALWASARGCSGQGTFLTR